MSEFYTSLHVSPRKKRGPSEFDDDTVMTPKKRRIAPPTPPATITRKEKNTPIAALSSSLSRLETIQSALQHALSHALATCAVSPSSDTGIVRNVLNHLSLTTYTGLTTRLNTDDLRRLCWLWEWDGKSLPKEAATTDVEENPFLDSQPDVQSKDWTRGAMGLILSPTTHYSKSAGKRVPVYGIGIEVEMNIDKDMGGGMAAVARWTAGAETRRKKFRAKLERWAKLHHSAKTVPSVPLANLPQLQTPTKTSNLTRALISASPKASSSFPFPSAPSTPTKNPSKSLLSRPLPEKNLPIPFPMTPSSKHGTPSKSSIPFPKTPSRHDKAVIESIPLTPRTPSSSISGGSSLPSTPVHQRGSFSVNFPQTPTSSRRQALYERVHQRSLTASPTKQASSGVVGGKLTKDQIAKLGQEEMRRRCLLGRLAGVAESVWMLFSSPPAGSSATPTTRKRRALPAAQVTNAVIKSSPVPISTAEAKESLKILCQLCPFFLVPMEISKSDWYEMPAPSSAPDTLDADKTPTKVSVAKAKVSSAEELVTRSPRRIKREVGGLRDVREIIRKELELQD